MNRRGFLGKLGLALAAVAVAPAINLLAEPETICHQGLLWQIQNSGNTFTYSSEINMTDFDAIVAALDNQYTNDDYFFMPIGSEQARRLGILND